MQGGVPPLTGDVDADLQQMRNIITGASGAGSAVTSSTTWSMPPQAQVQDASMTFPANGTASASKTLPTATPQDGVPAPTQPVVPQPTQPVIPQPDAAPPSDAAATPAPDASASASQPVPSPSDAAPTSNAAPDAGASPPTPVPPPADANGADAKGKAKSPKDASSMPGIWGKVARWPKWVKILVGVVAFLIFGFVVVKMLFKSSPPPATPPHPLTPGPPIINIPPIKVPDCECECEAAPPKQPPPSTTHSPQRTHTPHGHPPVPTRGERAPPEPSEPPRGHPPAPTRGERAPPEPSEPPGIVKSVIATLKQHVGTDFPEPDDHAQLPRGEGGGRGGLEPRGAMRGPQDAGRSAGGIAARDDGTRSAYAANDLSDLHSSVLKDLDAARAAAQEETPEGRQAASGRARQKVMRDEFHQVFAPPAARPGRDGRSPDAMPASVFNSAHSENQPMPFAGFTGFSTISG
jgi:hypothetical protein